MVTVSNNMKGLRPCRRLEPLFYLLNLDQHRWKYVLLDQIISTQLSSKSSHR